MVIFVRLMSEWLAAGGTQEFAIAPELWQAIEPHLQPGILTLEFGSGLSTWLFDAANTAHTALEHDASWARRCRRGNLSPMVRLHEQQIRDGWYDWRPNRPYDVILIDGPPGNIGREGVLPHVEKLCHATTIVFVDDVQRTPERKLAEKIAQCLDRTIETITCADGRESAII